MEPRSMEEIAALGSMAAIVLVFALMINYSVVKRKAGRTGRGVQLRLRGLSGWTFMYTVGLLYGLYWGDSIQRGDFSLGWMIASGAGISLLFGLVLLPRSGDPFSATERGAVTMRPARHMGMPPGRQHSWFN